MYVLEFELGQVTMLAASSCCVAWKLITAEHYTTGLATGLCRQVMLACMFLMLSPQLYCCLQDAVGGAEAVAVAGGA